MIKCDNLLREYLDWTNKDGADLTEAARWLRLHTDSKNTARRIWPDFSKGIQDYFRSDSVSESLQDEFYADERTEAGDRQPSGSVLNEVYSTEAPELNEAFKAGNRTRKKESFQDTVESVDNLQAQIDIFNRQTGDVYKNDIDIRDGRIYYNGWLYLYDCKELTALPANMTIRDGLQISGCTRLTSLPPGLIIKNNCISMNDTGVTSIPGDMMINPDCKIFFKITDKINHFFKKLNIPVYSDNNDHTGKFVLGSDWMSKRHLADQVTEAFRAGNRARKKETIQDTVADISDIKINGLMFCQKIYSYAVDRLGLEALLITDYSQLQALRGLVNYSEDEYPIVILSRCSNDKYSLKDGQCDESLTPDEFITISTTDSYFIAELALNSTELVDGPDDVPNPGKYDMRGQAEFMEFWNFEPYDGKFKEYSMAIGEIPKLSIGGDGLKYFKLSLDNLMKMLQALKKYAEDGAGADDIPHFTM